MNLTDFQSAIVSAIDAAMWFAEISVLSDDGYQNNKAQKALETDGCCVVVGMPSSGTIEAPVGKSASATASLIVDLLINPKVNAMLTVPRVAVDGLVAMIVAVNGSTSTPRVRNVQATDFDLVTFDEGLLAYTITVQAKVEFIP